MKYLCVKKCFWNNTLYEKGDTVDLNEKVKVPEHFKPLGRAEEKNGKTKKAEESDKDKK